MRMHAQGDSPMTHGNALRASWNARSSYIGMTLYRSNNDHGQVFDSNTDLAGVISNLVRHVLVLRTHNISTNRTYGTTLPLVLAFNSMCMDVAPHMRLSRGMHSFGAFNDIHPHSWGIRPGKVNSKSRDECQVGANKNLAPVRCEFTFKPN